jgi:hypothetical protein
MKNESQPNLAIETGVIVGEDVVPASPGDEVAILQVPEGECFGADSAGWMMWALIQEPYRMADLCETIVREYEAVDPVRCRRETLEFLRRLASARLITVC